MRTYTIHVARRPWATTDVAIDTARAVKEGFSWPAFFLSFIWALWHRLWLVAGAVLMAELILGYVTDLLGFDPITECVVSLGAAAIFGWIANDLLRHGLEQRGLTLSGVVLATSREEAVERYFGDAVAPRDGFAPSSTRSPL